MSVQDWPFGFWTKQLPRVSFGQAIFLCVIRSSFLPGTATDSLRATIWAHIAQEVRNIWCAEIFLKMKSDSLGNSFDGSPRCDLAPSSFPVISELAAVIVQALSEYSYDAEIANCSYNLDIGDGGVILTCFARRLIIYRQQAIKVPCSRSGFAKKNRCLCHFSSVDTVATFIELFESHKVCGSLWVVQVAVPRPSNRCLRAGGFHDKLGVLIQAQRDAWTGIIVWFAYFV